MRRSHRVLIIIAAALAALAIIVFVAVIYVTRMSFPQTRGTVHLDGLNYPVSIERDRYGIPHIYARTTHDLFFAEGYVHAQDRFWQMEFSRRIGEGRLSELFGPSQLQTDIFLRTLGIARVAKLEYEQADSQTRAVLEAYSAGVNAYISHRSPPRLGLEFLLLNLTGVKTKVDPWTPANSLEWAKMMALNLEDSWEGEVLMSRLMHTIGTRGLPELFSPYRPEMPFTVSNSELTAAPNVGAAMVAMLGSAKSTGSNAWVVSGSRSASGKPILANDMHLDLQAPSIWYEIGLHGITADGKVGPTAECPYNVYGFSLPGDPGIVAGHNGHIAWGMTALEGDVQDLYTEKINPENPDQYLVDGTWQDMKSVYEEIKIKGEQEPYRLRVRLTRHGPVLSDHGSRSALEGFLEQGISPFPGDLTLTAVTLRWATLEPSSVLSSMLRLDRARNYGEFRAALRLWTAPDLNVMYADTDGNIAFQSVGRIPIREIGSGEAPVPGWNSRFEWKGFIPFDDLPRSLNPSKGYIVNANNPPAGPAYRFLLGTELDYGYRARRIVAMIESHKDQMSLSDFEAIQADKYNFLAPELIAALKSLDLSPTPLERHIDEEKLKELGKSDQQKFREDRQKEQKRIEAARGLLSSWDGRMSGDSAQAALYAYFWEQLVTEIFRDQYPESEWPMAAGARAENAVHYLLRHPDYLLWDDTTTPARETRDEILVRAFRMGYRKLVRKQGTNPKAWRWDRSHTITFVNPTLGKSGIKLIENIFNRGPYPIGSGATQVDALAWKRKKPFEVEHIPSMRFIIDMAHMNDAVSIIPMGESGHPGNRHYNDFTDRWIKVQYHPELFARTDVDKHLEGRLTLQPK